MKCAKILGCGVLAGIAVCVSIGTADAQDGLATIHDWVRVGPKTCMADHFHSGSSTGQPSRKQAEAQAIASWASFTAWEYGNHWGSWRLAETRRVNCTGSGTNWACDIEARPCKMTRGRAR